MSEVRKLIKNMGVSYKDGSAGFPGYLYHPLPFKEYLDIPAHKYNCIDELGFILEDYDFTSKAVLEIGAAGGFFSFNLAQKGAHVVAYEGDRDAFKILQAVKKEKKIDNVYFVNKYFTRQLSPAHCIIMLNVAMWLHKQMGAEKLKELMKSLDCEVLFYQTAHAESNGMYKMDELKNKNDIENYLKECGFETIKCRKTIHDKKPRYFFTCHKQNKY